MWQHGNLLADPGARAVPFCDGYGNFLFITFSDHDLAVWVVDRLDNLQMYCSGHVARLYFWGDIFERYLFSISLGYVQFGHLELLLLGVLIGLSWLSFEFSSARAETP